MKKLLLYLWKGIFIMCTFLTFPLIWEYAKLTYEKAGRDVSHICFSIIYLLVVFGIVCVIGYLFNSLIDSVREIKKK